jgi:hypothetical protein
MGRNRSLHPFHSRVVYQDNFKKSSLNLVLNIGKTSDMQKANINSLNMSLTKDMK